MNGEWRGMQAKAKNGSTRSLSHLYWGWIRKVASEEGVVLPQSGADKDHLSARATKELASAIRARAEKIRNGTAPRDASSYIQLVSKEWLPGSEDGDAGDLKADFDDPDAMEETADFFSSSGGVILTY